jgi:hypothetical protein
MLNIAHDIEYMNPYPAGYVTSLLYPHIVDMPLGISIRFAPEDYDGIPMLHFYNTLKSTLAKEYGNENIRTNLQQQHGIVEATRLR